MFYRIKDAFIIMIPPVYVGKYFIFLFFFITNIGFAQDYSWTGNGDGVDFFDEANWASSTSGLSPADDSINPSQSINFNLLLTGESDAEANGVIQLATSKTLELLNSDLNAVSISGGQVILGQNSYVDLSATDPLLNSAQINFNDEITWVRFTNVNTNDAHDNYLTNFYIDSAVANYTSNIRFDNYYDIGTVIRPNSSNTSPLTIYEDENLSGTQSVLMIDQVYSGASIPNQMNDNIGSFHLKKGFMLTLAVNEDGTGKSRVFIASEEDIELQSLPIFLVDDTSFIRIVPWNWVSKKGTGGDILGMDNTWYYRWNNQGESDLQREYAPMSWGYGGANDSDDITLYRSKYKATHLLAFNEPDDCEGQSGQYENMCDVETALGVYENLMKTGLRLVSPACRQGAARTWLNEFNDLAVQNDIRIDVIALHWYDWESNPSNSPNADAQNIFDRFVAYLDEIHDLYDLPIWITEFNANKYRTEAVNREFMELAIPYLETLDYVERYAWFEPVTDVADFYDNANNLTSIGTLYKNQESTPSIPELSITGDDTSISTGQTATLNGVVYTTLAEAYTAAVAGETILIDGFFDEKLTINKAVNIQGDDPETDGIQFTGTGRVFYVTNQVLNNFTISNLTISGGSLNNANGAGILIDKSKSPQITLRNLIIEDNTAEGTSNGNGGGISINTANVDIVDCIIRENNSRNGGGIHIVTSDNANSPDIDKVVNIKRTLIHGNSTELTGAGFYIYATSGDVGLTANFVNTTIAFNTATTNGGIGHIFGKTKTGTSVINTEVNMTHVTAARNTAAEITDADKNKYGLYFTKAGTTDGTVFNAYNSIFVAAAYPANRGVNFSSADPKRLINSQIGGQVNFSRVDDDTGTVIGRTAGQIGLSLALSDEGGFSKVLSLSGGTNGAIGYGESSIDGVSLPEVDQRVYTRSGAPDAGAYQTGGTVYASTWTGIAADNNPNNAENWSLNIVPNTKSTVDVRSSDQITWDMDLSVDTINIASGGTLITTASLGGTINYSRDLNTSNWYIIGSPVKGQDVDDFIASEGLATNGTHHAFGTYNTEDNTWYYYQMGASSDDVLNSGGAYGVRLSAASGDITFSGTMKTEDTSVALTTTGYGFNSIGNPYPSYLDSAALLSGNSDVLDSQTIWVWNESTDTYDAKVTVEGFQLAPSQGFFVRSDGTAGSVNLNESFQSHQSTDTFQKTERYPELYLTLFDKRTPREAKLYYIAGTTTGFDNGFDGPMFGGVANSFAIYTHAVENGTGRDFAVQSLPDNDYDNMVVPVGINAKAGTRIDISARTVNFPEGVTIYLEDREQETFTLLSSSSNFITTLSADSNGVGRFYMHTKTRPLANDEEISSVGNLSLYDPSSHNLSVYGIKQGKANARIYDILGNEVVNTVFDGKNTNDIPLPNLAVGVYIVHLTTETMTLIKKIIIR